MHLVDTTLFYSPTSGGVRRYLSAKHAWLKRHTACRHTIVVPGDAYRVVPGDVTTVPGHALAGTFNYRLPLNPKLWSETLAALEPDFIEVGDAFHPAWCAWRVAQRRGIPAVAFFHSNLPQLIGRRLGTSAERVVGRYVRWLYERFDAVLAPSRAMCAYLTSLGVQHATYQPLGVDTEVFSPERRSLDLRRELGLDPRTRLLVFGGRFAGEKNMPILLQAFARLGKPYHLLLIGGGRSARPNPNVTIVPFRRDSLEFAAWLASADALVHAGTRETFGLVVVEAMACGRPVVAMRAGAIPEIVDESVGQLAEPHDAASLAEAVRALYDRDLDAVGAAARAKVLQQFTWNQALQTQLATYSSVAVSRRVPLRTRAVLELRRTA